MQKKSVKGCINIQKHLKISMCATTLKDLSVCNNWSNEELTFGAPVQASIFLSTLAVVHSHVFSNI